MPQRRSLLPLLRPRVLLPVALAVLVPFAVAGETFSTLDSSADWLRVWAVIGGAFSLSLLLATVLGPPD